MNRTPDNSWQALRAQRLLDAMKPVMIRFPSEWSALKLDEIRVRLNAALKTLVGENATFSPPTLGDNGVSRSNMREALQASADPAKVALLNDLRSAQESSIHTRSEPNATSGLGVAGFNETVDKINVAAGSLVAVFAIRQDADGMHFYEATTLAGNEAAPVAYPQDTPAQGGERATSAYTGATTFVRRPFGRVNPDKASKAIDPDTGEPLVVYHGTGADFVAFDEAVEGNHMSRRGR